MVIEAMLLLGNLENKGNKMIKISDEYGTDKSSDMLTGYWKPNDKFCDERRNEIRSAMDRCGLSVYGVSFLLSAKSLGTERRKVLFNLLA